jgi:hypothetical protein
MLSHIVIRNTMKQTAVEWLESRITVLIPDDIGSQLMYKNSIKQAKEMEKEQIIDAYLKDIGKVTIDKALVHWDKAEEYYNETYESKTNI